MSEDYTNTSGQGKDAFVLDIVAKRFNWGAFFFTWIWGIFNNTWITFLSLGLTVFTFFLAIILGAFEASVLLIFLKPIVWIAGLALKIWFGIMGNTWAWQNKKWESVESFHKTQRTWAIVGLVLNLVLVILLFVGIFAAMTLPSHISSVQTAKMNAAMKKHTAIIRQAATLNQAFNEKCKKDSTGLAKCFAQRLHVAEEHDNAIKLSDEAVYEFMGDGRCKDDYSCYAVVYPLGKTTKLGEIKENFSIYFKTDKDGYLDVVE